MVPLTLKTETTNICNANCSFCAYKHMTRPKGFMSMSLFKKAIHEFTELGGRRLRLSPVVGEALLDRDFLNRIRYVRQNTKIEYLHFFTNLIALDAWSDKEVFELLQLTDLIYVSIGPNRETYKKLFGFDMFEKLLKNIERLHSLNKTCELGFTGRTLENEKVDDRLNKLIGHGHWLSEYFNWSGLIKDVPLIENDVTTRCDIPFVQLVVFWDGKVGICPCYDYDAKLLIGDLTKDSLKEIIFGPRHQKLSSNFEHGILPDYCQRCSRKGR